MIFYVLIEVSQNSFYVNKGIGQDKLLGPTALETSNLHKADPLSQESIGDESNQFQMRD